MEYVKEVRVFVEGIWNMAEATTDNGVIKGNWNELKFRDEVLNACNGWTHILIVDQKRILVILLKQLNNLKILKNCVGLKVLLWKVKEPSL